jgi:hypothetical protein
VRALLRQAASRPTPAALLKAVLDVRAHAVKLLSVDDGAHVCGLVQRVADFQAGELLRELLEKRIHDRSVQKEPRPRRAGLTLTGKPHSRDHAVNRPVVVGVGKHNRGTLAAQFQGHGDDPVGRSVHDELADFG